MTDLRKAAEMALEVMEYNRANGTPNMGAAIEALRQELAMQKFSEVNQEIEEALKQPEQGNSSPNYPNTEPNTSFVDAVNMRQERVDETAKREHEPVAYVTIEPALDGDWRKCPSIKWFNKPAEGPLYTAPPKREWVGLTEDELNMIGDSMRTWNSHSLTDVYVAIEAKLKEKNT